MNYAPKLDRRSFVIGAAAAGGGLALGLRLPFGPDIVRAADGSPEVNAWVVIRPDDTVVIRIARSEMGQGSLTGLAQLVAEELECDWSKVTTEYPTPGQSLARKRVYGDMSTGGSRGIRTSQQYVREAGAAARTVLIQAAANEWKVPASECSAANSVITHQPSGRKTTYGKVAEAAARLEAPKNVPLKDPKDWKLVGKGVKRLDTADKLTGKQIYGIDIKMPGMLVATIKDSPVRTGKIKSFDAAKVAGMPGVKKVVQVGDSGVAVIADSYWRAHKAIEALPIVWDPGEAGKVSSASIAEFLKGGLGAEQAFVGNRAGDAKAAIAGAARKIEAVYSYPYQNHATMEPMNMTALYTADRCEVWGPTQNAEAALAAVSEESGLPIGKCDVHKFLCGGGFGRRGRVDYVRQAVAIAKEMPGTPIKLIWSREEDMTHDGYHPVTQAKLTAGIDAAGNVVGFHMRISGQSIAASLAPDRLDPDGRDPIVFQGLTPNSPEGNFGYAFPNLLIDHAMRNTHVLAGFWRGVNVNHNAIYTECFIDEVADALGQDKLAFRLKFLKPKHAAVLKAVAERAGWGTPPPQGVARGLAQYMAHGSYCAACAEVSVSPRGELKMHRIVAAIDPGYAVNPAQIERQVAGSFVFGLSALLYGECTVKDGAIEQTNFDTYNSLRIREMPNVEVIVMPSGGFWGGVGEPTVSVAAPAVLNAIYAATGKRLRSVPLMHEGIRTA
ncbi:MAG TPA: molybdopterin cofactor-binding domain-containing protein [Xanthobacteraceae bacterium]|jgi:isoquinoline 1-oxidoreductase beta subunit|nr:molybdopterin cofactor-binding domain-containing protein [Xanthobacteraceae bacterium]